MPRRSGEIPLGYVFALLDGTQQFQRMRLVLVGSVHRLNDTEMSDLEQRFRAVDSTRA